MTRGLKQDGLQDGHAYIDGEQVRAFHDIALTGRGNELLDDAQSRGSGGGGSDSGGDGRRDRGLSDWD